MSWTAAPAWPCGLSPRVRGNPKAQLESAFAAGSIPACAGEPTEWERGKPATRVYPRVCGEPRVRRRTAYRLRVYPRVCGGTHTRCRPRRPGNGLSPRVRGNRSLLYLRGGGQGSIPACAGEPPVHFSPIARRLVYPRVCGGTAWSSRAVNILSGLSPRVRGNLLVHQSVLPYAGSIPACAGEPPPLAAAEWRREVYPRVCGGTWRRR